MGSGGGNVTSCLGVCLRRAVTLVFLAPESSCDERDGGEDGGVQFADG